jgi:hypothetical protein
MDFFVVPLQKIYNRGFGDCDYTKRLVSQTVHMCSHEFTVIVKPHVFDFVYRQFMPHGPVLTLDVIVGYEKTTEQLDTFLKNYCFKLEFGDVVFFT